MKRSNRNLNLLLALGVIVLAVAPLIFIQKDEFSASDDKSSQGVEELRPGYKPWFESVFKPQGGEVETFLFATQAAIGSGVTCYILGLYKGRNDRQRDRDRD
jgi:cobalt/nickel transport protein